MNIQSFKSLIIKYSIGTLGLALVAIGVALSIKSDLGTAPVSCPPYVASLIGGFNFMGFHVGTVGQYTMLMHMIFILLQIAMLRGKFKVSHLMQIPAAIVFGLLTDLAIWAFNWIEADTYSIRLLLMVLSIFLTALGISLEVAGKAWMLAAEMTNSAMSECFGIKFSNAKISFDIFLVAISALTAWICFGNLLGNGTETIIREGTLISALFTGLCIKFTDKII